MNFEHKVHIEVPNISYVEARSQFPAINSRIFQERWRSTMNQGFFPVFCKIQKFITSSFFTVSGQFSRNCFKKFVFCEFTSWHRVQMVFRRSSFVAFFGRCARKSCVWIFRLRWPVDSRHSNAHNFCIIYLIEPVFTETVHKFTHLRLFFEAWDWILHRNAFPWDRSLSDILEEISNSNFGTTIYSFFLNFLWFFLGGTLHSLFSQTLLSFSLPSL